MEGTDCPKFIFFFSQIGVFLARLFSIGPQKTILRLLSGAVITDCCCENPEKTDSESGNWKKDVFNYRKQWKQFPTWQTTSDFADHAFSSRLLPNIFIGEIYSPSNHLPAKCHAHLSLLPTFSRKERKPWDVS